MSYLASVILIYTCNDQEL